MGVGSEGSRVGESWARCGGPCCPSRHIAHFPVLTSPLLCCASHQHAPTDAQDMFKQMMRSRLPPTSYFVEQLVEGVAKPDGWAVPEDPFAAETDDEEAEEFKHM